MVQRLAQSIPMGLSTQASGYRENNSSKGFSSGDFAENSARVGLRRANYTYQR